MEKVPKSTIPDIDKKKFLVPADLSGTYVCICIYVCMYVHLHHVHAVPSVLSDTLHDHGDVILYLLSFQYEV